MDVGDGFTPETGITLSGADEAELLKHGSTTTVDISGATWAAVTGVDGHYGLTLTTSHTDTVGMLRVVVQDASVCLPVVADFMVLPANVFDSLIGGSDYLQTDARELAGTTLTGRDIGASVLLSSGTGEGQVKLSGGYVAPNWGDVGNPTTTVGLSGTTVKTATDVEADTADIQTKIGSPAGASVSADVAAVKSDTAAILTDTGTTLDGKIDAIKAKTDSLTFTVAGQVDANMQYINDTEWDGDGSGGDKFRPAGS